MSLPTRWYHASIQSTYCDCPDWTSDCKHLYGIRLIIQHHFPHLYGVLPIVDNAHALGLMQHNIDVDGNDQGRSEGLNIDVGGNDEGGVLNNEDGLNIEHKEGTSIDDQINICIQDLKNILQDLQEGCSVYSCSQKDTILQQLKASKEKIAAMLVPAEIDLPMRGSIRQIQAHVTLTRLLVMDSPWNLELHFMRISHTFWSHQSKENSQERLGASINAVGAECGFRRELVFGVPIVAAKH